MIIVMINNGELKVTTESDPSQSAYELPLKFGVRKQTLLTHLARIGKAKKLDNWLLREVNEKQKQKRWEAGLMLHFSPEKWIQYGNCKRSAQWLDKDESPKHTPKRTKHQKKLLVSVLWSSAERVCGHLSANEVLRFYVRSNSELSGASRMTNLAVENHY
uniref:Uncharacterized protein n=1 Tax=Glossina palpalis gambiensis TaxID=67801 RepID=A0A1B0AVL2_9MUSC